MRLPDVVRRLIADQAIEPPSQRLLNRHAQERLQVFRGPHNLPSTGTLDDNTVSALQALCAAREESGHPEPGEYEEYDVNEPEPQQWPKSRIFNPPPAQIVPAGPYQTPSLCQSILDDHSQLLFAVTELKSWLRRRPSNPATVVNRSDMVRNLSRKIVARLQNREYVALGCTQRDFHVFASSVDALRGGERTRIAALGLWRRARASKRRVGLHAKASGICWHGSAELFSCGR